MQQSHALQAYIIQTSQKDIRQKNKHVQCIEGGGNYEECDTLTSKRVKSTAALLRIGLAGRLSD